MLKLPVPLRSKELFQASPKDGSWAATLLPAMGTACPPRCQRAPVAALLPLQEFNTWERSPWLISMGHEGPVLVLRTNWGKEKKKKKARLGEKLVEVKGACGNFWMKWSKIYHPHPHPRQFFILLNQACFCLTENAVLSLIFRLFILLKACEVIYEKRTAVCRARSQSLTLGSIKTWTAKVFRIKHFI